MMNKYELKQQLQGSVVSVVFTKADGTERTMRCTLLAEYLPAHNHSFLSDASTSRLVGFGLASVLLMFIATFAAATLCCVW